MANRSRITRFPSAVRSRRQTDWALTVFTTTYVTIAGSSKVLVAAITAAQLGGLQPATLIRTRGYLSIRPGAESTDQEQLGALGVAFVNDTALGLGVTGIPGPGTDANFDGWFVHQFYAGNSFDVGAGGVEYLPIAAFGFEIDSKAMRKFTDDVGLAFMVENQGGADHRIALQLRMLIKAG